MQSLFYAFRLWLLCLFDYSSFIIIIRRWMAQPAAIAVAFTTEQHTQCRNYVYICTHTKSTVWRWRQQLQYHFARDERKQSENEISTACHNIIALANIDSALFSHTFFLSSRTENLSLKFLLDFFDYSCQW